MRTVLLMGATLVVAFLIMQVGPYQDLTLAALPGGILDEVPRAEAAQLRSHRESIGAAGRALYREHFWWDIPFGLCNLVFMATWITAASRRFRRARLWLLAIPAAAFAFDIVENVMVRRVMLSDSPPSELATTVLAYCTTAKLALIGASLPVAVVATVMSIVKGRRQAAG